MTIRRRDFLFCASTAFLFPSTNTPANQTVKLQSWRGFNLTNRLHDDHQAAFSEEEFDLIAGWGFNFVRLPLDYRIWTDSSGNYIETELKSLEKVVAWGQARDIHVNLCLHRAPGYSVQGPIDTSDLWKERDPAQSAFVRLWKMLAARFLSVGPAYLSFNLVNEPPKLEPETYVSVIGAAAEAIRTVDAYRIIIADGLPSTNYPIMEPVVALSFGSIKQSLHMYFPDQVTGYKQGWAAQYDNARVPSWPTATALCGFMAGPAKTAYQAPLIIRGNFETGTVVSLDVTLVSSFVKILWRVDGEELAQTVITAEPESCKALRREGEERRSWLQCALEKAVSVAIPRSSNALSIEVVDGDWFTFSALEVTHREGQRESVLTFPAATEGWQKNPEFVLTSKGDLIPISGPSRLGKQALQNVLIPWCKLGASNSAYVGEFGVSSETPHGVTLAWMRDALATFKHCELGWALWQLRGPWGVLDSRRADVKYETLKSSRLDRSMLELLRSY